MDAGNKRPKPIGTPKPAAPWTPPKPTTPVPVPPFAQPAAPTRLTAQQYRDLTLASVPLNSPGAAPVATSKPGEGKSVFATRILGPSLRPRSNILSPAFDAFLNEKTRSKVTVHNNIRPLFDGQSSFAERNKLISAATSSIHLQTFIFTDDDTGWELARRLAERARAGVDVRVIIDGLGSNRAKDEIFDFMRAAGVEVRAHETGLDLTSVNNRWHEKHLVVDGKVAVEGGMNIADEYRLGGSGRMVFRKDKPAMHAWRDVDVRVEGAAVHEVQRAFMRNWALLGDPIPADKTAKLFPAPTQDLAAGREVRVVQHHPHGEPPDDHTLQLYLHAINSATSNITIENAYFIPPKALRDALIAAAKRGVDVKVLTNSKTSSDMGFVVDAARWFYDSLLDAGVRIFEKLGGTLHSKTAGFDGVYSIIGSCNLNGRSDGRDTESVVCVRGEVVAQSLEDRFKDGLNDAVEITQADLVRSPLMTAKQWALSTVAWTL